MNAPPRQPRPEPTPAIRLARQALRIAVTRARIANLVRWQPIADPQPGYTVIIGATAPLAPLLALQLELLARQRLPHHRETVIVFDRPQRLVPAEAVTPLLTRYAQLRPRVAFYSDTKHDRLRRIGWSKCYSWLSWAIAIGMVRTQHAILHDFDALPIDPDFFESRYRRLIAPPHDTGDATAADPPDFLGVNYYTHNGAEPGDRLAATWELAFNAAAVRDRFRPIDLFNRTGRSRGRWLNFDTFHWLQSRCPRAARLADDDPRVDEQIVHATQLICQVNHLTHRRKFVPPPNATVMLAPYLLYAAGETAPLEALCRQLEDPDADRVAFLGRDVCLQHLDADRVHGLRAMAEKVEAVLATRTRPAVSEYFDRLERRHRKPTGATAVAA